jgi:hypothetical protein
MSEWAEVVNKNEDPKDEPAPVVAGPADRVTVGQETFLYAMNDVKPSDPKAAAKLVAVKPEYQTVVEVQRWLEEAKPVGSSDLQAFPVGEWVVADRVIVNRGEYLQRTVDMEVPTWLVTEEKWAIASLKGSTKKKVVSMDITAGTGLDRTLLVDFQGGPVKYDKVTGLVPNPMGGEKVDFTPVKDTAASELILLTPDGRLVVHDSKTDAKDPDREARAAKWTERLKDIKENKSGGTGKDPSKNPFGTPNP